MEYFTGESTECIRNPFKFKSPATIATSRVALLRELCSSWLWILGYYLLFYKRLSLCSATKIFFLLKYEIKLYQVFNYLSFTTLCATTLWELSIFQKTFIFIFEHLMIIKLQVIIAQVTTAPPPQKLPHCYPIYLIDPSKMTRCMQN